MNTGQDQGIRTRGVGQRDPFPYENLVGDFDDVVDIAGDIVVWEGDGDIYGADISDLSDIRATAARRCRWFLPARRRVPITLPR